MATAKKPDTKVVTLAGDPEVTAELSRSLGLQDAELARAVKELGRNLTHAELGILSVLWSEREAQKSAKAHVKRLPAGGAHTLSQLGHAAGAIDLGNGLVALVSLSTSQAVDVGQAATQSAGHALRSVVAAGARPLALFDAVYLGAADAPETAGALRALATRLGSYARDVGVTVNGGNLQFDKRYQQSPLVQSVAVAVAKSDALIEGRATGLGNTVVFVGAQAASDGQASDAFAQRRLTDAVLAALRSGSVAGAYAIGPSGLAGAMARLAQNGETGIELDLDAVPRKASTTPFDTLCSEGSEQMLLVVRKGREDNVLKALSPFDIEAQIVGRVTNTERLVCKASVDGKGDAKQSVVVADLPVSLLTRDAPSYERPAKAAPADPRPPEVTLKRNEDAESELVRLLGSCNVGSREWLLKRLESNARNAAPTKNIAGDAAVLSIPAEEDGAAERLLALSIDGNTRCLSLDPRQGAAMAVAECARNLVCVGAEPVGIVHGLSFADPSQPSAVWQLSEAVDGMHDACLALKLPVLAGSVSFGAESAPATPTVAVLGSFREPGDRLGMGFGRQADMVALLGAQGAGNLAGSEFATARGEVTGRSPALDLGAEVKLQRAVLEMAREKLLSSAHDVSDGGLGVALAECCIAGKIGCSVELPAITGASTLQALFHEEPSRVVVSFPPENRAKVQERCTALGVPFELLGFVGGDTLEIEDLVDVPVQVLAESHTRALDRLVEG